MVSAPPDELTLKFPGACASEGVAEVMPAGTCSRADPNATADEPLLVLVRVKYNAWEPAPSATGPAEPGTPVVTGSASTDRVSAKVLWLAWARPAPCVLTTTLAAMTTRVSERCLMACPSIA